MNLLAISPATKAVALGSAAVVVSGLSMRKLAGLIVAYPDLVGFVVGGKLDVAALLEQAPDAALAVFSLGVVGRHRSLWSRPVLLITDGNDDLLKAFDAAPAGQQIEALGAIFDLTTKGGDRALPFLKAVLARPAADPGPAPIPTPPEPAPPSETPAESMPASSSG